MTMIKLTQRCKRILLHLSILETASVTDVIKEEIREFRTLKLIETSKTLCDPKELKLHWTNLIKVYWRDMQRLCKYDLIERIPNTKKYRLTDEGKKLLKRFHTHPLLLLKSKIEKER